MNRTTVIDEALSSKWACVMWDSGKERGKKQKTR